MEIDNKTPATTPLGVAAAVLPQFPAHPDRKQDDSAGQVSWLPGLRFPSTFPRAKASVAI